MTIAKRNDPQCAGGQRQAPLGPAVLQPVRERPGRSRGQCEASHDIEGDGRGGQRVAPAGQCVDLSQREGLPAAELCASRQGRAPARDASDQGRAAASQQTLRPAGGRQLCTPCSALRPGPGGATAGTAVRIRAVCGPRLCCSRRRSRRPRASSISAVVSSPLCAAKKHRAQ